MTTTKFYSAEISLEEGRRGKKTKIKLRWISDDVKSSLGFAEA